MIAIDNLKHRFGKKHVINDVSLHINRGERFAIFGSTGSGKSTLLKILSGVYPVQDGLVNINGKNIADLSVGVITTVWQSRALFPHLNVRENIKFGLTFKHNGNRSAIAKRLKWVAELLQIEYLLDRGIAQLSGGESQKVALARALAVDPDILLLDEPFTGIDKIFKTELRVELNTLFRELNKTIVIVSHDMDDLYALSDRIAVLENGRVSQCNTPQYLHNNPSTYFIARSFGEYNIIEALVIDKQEKNVTIEVAELKPFAIVTEKMNIEKGTGIYLGLLPEAISMVSGAEVRSDELIFTGKLQSYNTRSGRVEATILVAQKHILKIYLPFEISPMLTLDNNYTFSIELKKLQLINKN